MHARRATTNRGHWGSDKERREYNTTSLHCFFTHRPDSLAVDPNSLLPVSGVAILNGIAQLDLTSRIETAARLGGRWPLFVTSRHHTG